ncbi:MAG: methyltransferase domain-containing protein, partial [Bacteroidota bacterium]
LDFYDPHLHTEISIKRARAAYPNHPGTERVVTHDLPLKRAAVDAVFVTLAAHEIRDDAERVRFFRQLRNSIKPAGKIVVTEHLRDTANFLAYTFGFFHFLPRETWLQTFNQSGLRVESEQSITPFITVFNLISDGNTP